MHSMRWRSRNSRASLSVFDRPPARSRSLGPAAPLAAPRSIGLIRPSGPVAAPNAPRAVGMAAMTVHVLVLGSYASAVTEFGENSDPHKDLALEDGDRHESYDDQDREVWCEDGRRVQSPCPGDDMPSG